MQLCLSPAPPTAIKSSMVEGNSSSTRPRSLEKRLRMRPTGLRWKKLIGALMTAPKALSFSWAEALAASIIKMVSRATMPMVKQATKML